MNLTDDEMNMLEAAKDETAWNEACDKIQKARRGEYPPDWGYRVIGSGLLNRKIVEFSGATSPTA